MEWLRVIQDAVGPGISNKKISFAYREGLWDHEVAEIWSHREHEADDLEFLVKTWKVTKTQTYASTTLTVSEDKNYSRHKTYEEAEAAAEDKVAMMYGEKRPGFKYVWDDDWYGYQPLWGDETCWYIEGRDGKMLIGDRLPSTEEQAKAYCRCANIAYKDACQRKKS